MKYINPLLIYCLLTYLVIAGMAFVWTLPQKGATTQILNSTTSNPLGNVFSPSSPMNLSTVEGIALLALPIVAIGFAMGLVVKKYHKKHPEIKAAFLFSYRFWIFLFLTFSLLYLSHLIVFGIGSVIAIPSFLLSFALYLEIAIILWLLIISKLSYAVIFNNSLPRNWFNLTGILISIVAASELGRILPIWGALLLLGFISAYDLIAVFVTKHMQALVGFILNNEKVKTKDGKTKEGFMLPAFIYSGDISDLTKLKCVNCGLRGYHKVKDTQVCKYCGRIVKLKKGTTNQYDVVSAGKDKEKLMKESKAYKKAYEKASKTSLLGCGDLVIPGLVVASAAFSGSLLLGVGIAVAGFIGMIGNFLIIRRYKVSLPALPLVFVAQLAFYIIVLLL